MKRSIYLTLTALVISVLCVAVLYECCIPVIDLAVTLLFCTSYVVFLVGCSFVWSYWTKNTIKDTTDTYLGFFLVIVAIIAICCLLISLNNFGLLTIALITGFSGFILLVAGEVKRYWKNMAKLTKSNTAGKASDSTMHKPRKISQEEFKQIVQFCKENNLGHLTLSQAIVAWDEYCSL